MLGQTSSLDQYITDYGSKLQSMLAGNNQLQASLGPEPTAPLPQSALAPPGRSPAQEPESPDGPNSVRTLYNKMPEAEQTKATDHLEKKVGSINDAYDEMVQHLGQRPDGTLSRNQKGMLLMEFGLNLMANSSGRAYGKDVGGAAGAAGLKTLDSYQGMTKGAQDQWDKSRLAIEGKRADANADLAKQNSAETFRSQLADENDQRRVAREGNEIGLHFPDPNNVVHAYSKTGRNIPLLDAQGRPVKERPPASALDGGKGFEKQWAYNQYLEANGKDPRTGKPLTGAALTKVKNDALKYAGGLMRDSRTSQQKNIEDLMSRGVPQDEAGDIVYRLRDNPQKAQAAIAAALARSGMLGPDEIAQQAEQITASIVGGSALKDARTPKIPPKTNDPLGIR